MLRAKLVLLQRSDQGEVRTPGAWLPVLVILVLITAFDLGPFFAASLFLVIAFTLAILSIQTTLLTPVQLVIFAYVLAFPMAILLPDYFQSTSRFSPPPKALEDGMLWSLRGFAMFALGYAFVNQHKGVNQYPIRERSSHFLRMRMTHAVDVTKWVGLLAIVGFASDVVMGGGITMPGITAGRAIVAVKDIESDSLRQVFGLLAGLRYPFFSMYLILRHYKQTSRALTLILSILLSASIVEFTVSGSKGDLIRIFVSIFLAMSLLPVRVRLRNILLGLAVLFIINGTFSVVGEYRSIMNSQYKVGANISSFSVQISSFKLALSRTFTISGSHNRQTDVSTEAIASRFGSPMFSFANLLRFTDGQSPYENAWKSLLVPVYSILPRSLAAGKPVFFGPGRHAAEYYNWKTGGISVSMPGSLYFAWGYPGILFGMFFLGSLLAYVVKQVNSGGRNWPYWAIILVTMVVVFMEVDAIFQAALTNVTRVALLMWLLHLFYSRVRRSRQTKRQKLRFNLSNSQSTRV